MSVGALLTSGADTTMQEGIQRALQMSKWSEKKVTAKFTARVVMRIVCANMSLRVCICRLVTSGT